MIRLAAEAERYALQAFGQRLDLESISPKTLPHFINDRYHLWAGNLRGHRFVLMAFRQPRQGATTEYLKHRDVVRRALRVDLVILLLDHVSTAIRRQMIDRQIGFLAPGAQLYVPEAMLDLRERTPMGPSQPAEHLSPTTQLLILATLQGIALETESLTGLAEQLGVAVMSMSRALDELESLGIALPQTIGRARQLYLVANGQELWALVQDRLRSPVRKVRLIAGNLATYVAPLAGESALAQYTMLARPRTDTRAISAASWTKVEKSLGLEPAAGFENDRIEIQTWSYDPRILARDGLVDRLSLYLSIRGDPDERVAQAADELLEAFSW